MNQVRKTITVVQGEFAVSADPQVIMSTLLGSCIAVCLHDGSHQIGGMNHFLLASTQEDASRDLKYGVNAMELLINRLLRKGADRSLLEAKIFGGARMTQHSRDIGGSNAAFALDFLNKEGIPLRAQSVGGTSARRVQFNPTTGAARQLQVSGPSPIEEVPAIPTKPTPEITLF